MSREDDLIAELRRQRDEAVALVRQIVKTHPHPGRPGNAPGHAHGRVGIWDDDNGKLAGKRCEWCATWARARALIAKAGGKP